MKTKHKTTLFITGESGTIPKAMQSLTHSSTSDFVVNNDQILDPYNINFLKKHQSFKVRKPELDFTDRDLLFSPRLVDVWKATDIVIHSGAFVGTDFCDERPNDAIRVNVEGTKNIVDVCNKFDIKLVYFSTTAIFNPKDYSMSKLITEDTEIRPQTLYGITKFAGEQIVKQCCNKNSIIIRPVFGFGDYPDDLHSALTKFIYTLYHFSQSKNGKATKSLQILLNKNIQKSYTRVGNIAKTVLEISKYERYFDRNEEFNIGCNHNDSYNWYQLYDFIKVIFFRKFNITLPETLDDVEAAGVVRFDESKDYLHWHNISTVKLDRYKLSENIYNESLYDGIESTIKSVINNSNIIPYWI